MNWVIPSNPEGASHEPIGPFDSLEMCGEDLRTGEGVVIAQLHDDNYWRLNRKLDKRSEVDGWMYLSFSLKD